MIHSLELKDGMLTVRVIKPSPAACHLICDGVAQGSMPPWASRQALIALIDAAVTEAETQADRKVELARKGVSGG